MSGPASLNTEFVLRNAQTQHDLDEISWKSRPFAHINSMKLRQPLREIKPVHSNKPIVVHNSQKAPHGKFKRLNLGTAKSPLYELIFLMSLTTPISFYLWAWEVFTRRDGLLKEIAQFKIIINSSICCLQLVTHIWQSGGILGGCQRKGQIDQHITLTKLPAFIPEQQTNQRRCLAGYTLLWRSHGYWAKNSTTLPKYHLRKHWLTDTQHKSQVLLCLSSQIRFVYVLLAVASFFVVGMKPVVMQCCDVVFN